MDYRNPDFLVDRDDICDTFKGMLQFSTEKRILAIRAGTNQGKSLLLGRFAYECRVTDPKIPAAYVDLDESQTKSPLDVISRLLEELNEFRFPHYEECCDARLSGNFDKVIACGKDFKGSASHIYGSVHDVNLTGSYRPSVIGSVDRNITLHPGATYNETRDIVLTPKQDERALAIMIEAFLYDFREICMVTPIVLLLDTFQNALPNVQNWITKYLLQSFYFAKDRPPRMLLVIASQKDFNFVSHWSAARCDEVVEPVNRLGGFGKEHLRSLLDKMGRAYDEGTVDWFYARLENGTPPGNIVAGIQALLPERGT